MTLKVQTSTPLFNCILNQVLILFCKYNMAFDCWSF